MAGIPSSSGSKNWGSGGKWKPKTQGGSGRGGAGGPTAGEINAYRHSLPATEKEVYKLDFSPNMLDNYDTYTYHWKLFITSTANANSGAVLSPENQTIIAESGVTDLTIDKVEFNGIAVPSVEAGTGTQTIVKFEIVEPSGAGLLDKMYAEASALGIGNWLVMPCFLQLEFRGRTPEEATAIPSSAPGGLGDQLWVWPIKVTDVKAHVANIGTRYDFSGIVYNELAQANAYFSIQHSITLDNITTFEDSMKRLADKINADQYIKLIDNYSIPDVYNIVVDDELAPLVLAPDSMIKNTARGGSFIDLKKKSATYKDGTSIDKIVDSLLANSEKYQTQLQGTDTPDGEVKKADQIPWAMRKLWRIVTETRPIVYDPVRQDNAVEVTIYIVQYDMGAIDDTQEVSTSADEAKLSNKIVNEYIKNKILNKKYSYIFTGLNDQILQFDLTMNFAYAATLARFGGVYSDSSTSDTGLNIDKARETEKKLKEKLREAIHFINDATSETDILKKISETRAEIDNAKLKDTELALRYNKLLESARPADRRNHTTSIIAAGGTTRSGEPDTKTKITAKSLAEPVNGYKFISDVNSGSADAKAAISTNIDTRRSKLRPIPRREGAQENTVGPGGIDTTTEGGRARVSNIFSTALYSTVDASLTIVKLLIKGDPFWLFPRSVGHNITVLPYKSMMDTKTLAIDEIKNSHRKNSSSVNFYGTDNFIVILFRTPQMAIDETGVIDSFENIETFSGVYKVISVLSKFEMGKFTQELTCNIDPMVDILGFLKQMKTAAYTADTPIATEKLSNTTIPPAAVKNPTRESMGLVPYDKTAPGKLKYVDFLDTLRALPPGPGSGSSTRGPERASGV
jgi:hypothetical protein